MEVIEFQLSYLKILKDDAVKLLFLICQQIWKTQQWPQDWKRLVFIPIPKKGNGKECSNYCRITLNSHASKIMFKILQARLPQYINLEFPDVQAGFRKGRGTRNQIANIHCIIVKAREFWRSIYSASLTTLKPLYRQHIYSCVDYNQLWKILKRDQNTRPPYLSLHKPAYRLRNNS